jgi:hypothetical protein
MQAIVVYNLLLGLARHQQLLQIVERTLTSSMNNLEPSSLSSSKVHFPDLGMSRNLN